MTLPRTIALVLVLIVLGTAFFVARPDPPEMVRAVSDDGLFQVEVLASQHPTLEVTTMVGGASTARVSPIYEVTGSWSGGEITASVSLASSLNPADHILASWNDMTWVPQNGTTYTNGAFREVLSLPGKMALFQRQNVEIPRRYEEIVSELIANRPEETDRAHINLSYAFEPDDYILIRSARVTAACGGNLQAPRGRTETEEVVEPAVLTVNGREREGWIRVQAKWELENGCAEGEVFERVE